MKTIFKYIYISLFFILTLAPAGLFAFNYFTGNTSRANIEKTADVPFPTILTDNKINDSFDDECENWLNQNLPYRDILITNINVVLSDLFGVPTSNVVTGLNGWIYSSETVDNYLDTNALSDADIQRIAVTLSLIQERVEANDGNFLFVPAPNKNSVYPEYMPVRYIHSAENNLTRLYSMLDNEGVNYTDLKGKMLQQKDEFKLGRLYYKRDTHWNAFGARIGYESIMEGINRLPVSYAEPTYSAEYTKRGDLDKLLFPADDRVDKEYIIDNGMDYDGFEFIFPTGITDTKAQLDNFMSDKEDHDNNFTTKQRKPSDNNTLYMIRDSFGRALLPYMIDTYAEATFVRTTTPSIEKSIECNDVIYEICERNLINLISSAPFMYAPTREANDDYELFNSDLNRYIGEDEGYAYKIYGTIDPKMLGEDGRIYVILADAKSQDMVFEAFPIYETTSLSEKSIPNDSNSCGYSLYIDKSALELDQYDLRIMSGSKVSDVLGTVAPDASNAEGDAEDMGDSTSPYTEEQADHLLEYRGVTFGIGDNINSLKGKLGEQAAPSEIIVSCLSGNDAELYYYPNITIETEMDGSIYYISLMDNSYSDGKKDAVTTQGITIGSNKMDIWDKLGKSYKENDKNCTYQTDHVNITYSYKSGKVTSVILEDRKYIAEIEEEQEQEIPGVEYESGNTYLYDETHLLKTGWQLVDGEYYFFDRTTGERIVGQVVDGIEIGEDGELELSEYDKAKIETMMKAHRIVLENTNPSDTMEEKRKKVFDWVLSFPYRRGKRVRDYMDEEGVEILFANDIFDEGIGDCVSEAAALAFLFHEVGYNNVYWVHDTGHSWVRSDDKLFDPVFAEGRDYNANYDAEFTDYRATMAHSMLIY